MKNLETVKLLYKAFSERDRDRIFELFDPNIKWIQNEGFPNGGEHIGAKTVLDDVLGKFRIDWESFQADVQEWLNAGDTIIALGEYRGTYKSTGRSMVAAFAHVYDLRDGKIIRFRQYTDTLMIARAVSDEC